MRAKLINQSNYSINFKPKASFGAGMTPEIMREIQSADVLEISHRLAKKGIPTDFGRNKFVAWGNEKSISVFRQLNERFGAKLALPKGIYFRDLEILDIREHALNGFCNFFPTKLIKNSNEEVPGQTLFFNTFETTPQFIPPEDRWLCNWDNIDSIADYDYKNRHSATDHFLGIFLHEFVHNAHLERVWDDVRKGEIVRQRFESAKDEKHAEEFRRKYGEKISKICNYALTNPLEAIACDISRLIANSLNPITLEPTRNPFIGTPYEKLHFWQRADIPNYSDQDRPLEVILRNFWNGMFE